MYKIGTQVKIISSCDYNRLETEINTFLNEVQGIIVEDIKLNTCSNEEYYIEFTALITYNVERSNR